MTKAESVAGLADEKLRHIAAALDLAFDGLALLDLDLRIQYANTTLCAIGGYESAQDLIGHDVADFLTTETMLRVREHLAVALSGRRAAFEGAARGADGQPIPIEVGASALRCEDGEPYAFLAIVRDITERKRAEQALRESETKYRLLYENLNDAAFLADAETGIILEANKQAEILLGRTRDEIIGMHQTELHPPGQDEDYGRRFERHVQAGRTADYDGEAVRKDRSVVPVAISAAPMEIAGRRLIVGLFRDISKRKRAEEALRESQRDLSTLVEISKDAMVAIGADGLITLFNPAAETMFGWTAAEMIGQPLDRLMPQAYRDRHKEYVRGYFATGSPNAAVGSTVELPAVRRNGEDFTVELSLSATEREGRPMVLAVMRDITQRKRVEEALRQSEGRLRTLIESLPQKIFYKDRDAVYVWCNDNYARDLGISAGEICGKTDYDFHPVELAEKYRADDRRVMDSAVTEDMEERYIQDGQERWVHTIKTPVADENGNTVGVLGIFWDITERKRAEEALRQSEERYRALFENMGIGISLIRDDRRIIAVNPAFCAMFHTTPDKMVGGLCYREFEKREETCPHCTATKALETGKPQETIATGTRDDGSKVVGHILTFPIRDADGKCRSFIEVVEDVTERQRTEQALEAKHRELESFVYTVSHDLRAPLVSLEGFAELLADEHSERLDAEGQDYLRRLRSNVSTMDSLLTDLLELSRVARAEEPKQAVPVAQIVAEALENLAGIINKSGAQVTVARDLPTVWYSRVRLFQVFANLIGNAIKFSREGVPPQVEIKWQSLKTGCRFLVRDNGIGIADNQKHKLFEIFSRLKKKAVEGTGIGLAIVKRIVENHGGQVGVESTPGEGSTFWFTVPLQTPAE